MACQFLAALADKADDKMQAVDTGSSAEDYYDCAGSGMYLALFPPLAIRKGASN